VKRVSDPFEESRRDLVPQPSVAPKFRGLRWVRSWSWKSDAGTPCIPKALRAKYRFCVSFWSARASSRRLFPWLLLGIWPFPGPSPVTLTVVEKFKGMSKCVVAARLHYGGDLLCLPHTLLFRYSRLQPTPMRRLLISVVQMGRIAFVAVSPGSPQSRRRAWALSRYWRSANWSCSRDWPGPFFCRCYCCCNSCSLVLTPSLAGDVSLAGRSIAGITADGFVILCDVGNRAWEYLSCLTKWNISDRYFRAATTIRDSSHCSE